MTRHAKRRRPDKQRARRRAQRQAEGNGGPADGPGPRPEQAGAPDLQEHVRTTVPVLARAVANGARAEDAAEVLVRELRSWHPDAVCHAVDAVVSATLNGLFHGGWCPLDLHELGRRRLDGTQGRFLLEAVTATTEHHPAGRTDPRWTDQLGMLGAVTGSSPDGPHLTGWAVRHGLTHRASIATVIAVLAVLLDVPCLEPTLSPPGELVREAAPRRELDTAGVRMLGKVRSLLAKAESTDYDEEAEALTAKAQQLMARYSIDHAMLAHYRGDAAKPTLRRLWLDNPYVNAKGLLVSVVSDANRCRAILSSSLGFVTVYGDDIDLHAVDLLSTSLLVQATRAMRGCQPWRGGTGARTRSFRQSFLVAYAARIGERLRESAATAQSETDDERLLPVLAERSRAVDDLVSTWNPTLRTTTISSNDAAGYGAGRAAADRAVLDVHQAVARASA